MPRDRTKAPRGCQRIATFVREHDVDLDTLWRLVLTEKLRVWAAIRPEGGGFLASTKHHTIVNSQGEVVQGDLGLCTKESWHFALGMLSKHPCLFEGRSVDVGWRAAQDLVLQDLGQVFIEYLEILFVSPAQVNEAMKGRASFRRKSHDDRAPVEAAWDALISGWRERDHDPFSAENEAETRDLLKQEADEVLGRGADDVVVAGQVQEKPHRVTVGRWISEYIEKHRGRS